MTVEKLYLASKVVETKNIQEVYPKITEFLFQNIINNNSAHIEINDETTAYEAEGNGTEVSLLKWL